MTVGENIQKYRKALGLSQEELGQKLLVSRQTISLWETDQTLPTIDNFMRLREVFGVSVDAILGDGDGTCKPEPDPVAEPVPEPESEPVPEPAPEPKETYRFHGSKEDLGEIDRLQRKMTYHGALGGTMVSGFALLFFIWTSAADLILGFLLCALCMYVLFLVKGIRVYNTVWKRNLKKISETTYEYRIYEEYLGLTIWRADRAGEGAPEKVRESKCYFDDIESVRQYEKWVFFQFGGQSFFVKRNDLREDSAFWAVLDQKMTTKKANAPLPSKWRTLSILLVIASIATLWGALFLVGAVSAVNYAFVENMWVFFLLTPIPIGSLVFGLVAKSKGFKATHNVIIGIVMTAILCIYGSFVFVFADFFDHSDGPILQAEQTLGIDIPDHKRINTQKLESSLSRGYVFYTSDVYFDRDAAQALEAQISEDERWLSDLPSPLVGITSPWGASSFFDYILICNLDTGVCNALPEEDGTYRFLSLLYRAEERQLEIVEYSIDYTG